MTAAAGRSCLTLSTRAIAFLPSIRMTSSVTLTDYMNYSGANILGLPGCNTTRGAQVEEGLSGHHFDARRISGYILDMHPDLPPLVKVRRNICVLGESIYPIIHVPRSSAILILIAPRSLSFSKCSRKPQLFRAS